MDGAVSALYPLFHFLHESAKGLVPLAFVQGRQGIIGGFLLKLAIVGVTLGRQFPVFEGSRDSASGLAFMAAIAVAALGGQGGDIRKTDLDPLG
jgi:hypothetical protein